MQEPSAKKKVGFALMDKQRVSELARKGGKAVQKLGTAHRFTHEEAVIAGRLGAKARASK